MPKIIHSISDFLKRPEALGLLILGVLHALAAYFSFGFHHPDEHFQILEFANYWAGLVKDPSGLPWEFTAQIRPWFQPMIHGVVMKLAVLVSFYNPFDMAFFFRLLYAALNILSIWLLWKEFKKRFPLNPGWFVWIGLMWFYPYIHVRTSSENLSGIFLTFAFVAYLRNKPLFWIGLLFGFSFLARYQVALGVFGFGVYLLIQARTLKREHLLCFLGFLLPVALGVVLDRMGYGNWVFTPYRYFKVNLVDGVAATFNPYPWYQYFIWILQLNPLVSIPLVVGMIFYMRKTRMDAISSFVLSFFILHLFITNKEYRFLFPILNLVPLMMAVGFEDVSQIFLSRTSLSVYAAISMLGFTVSSMRGASVETLWPIQTVHDYAKPGEIWLSNRNYVDQFTHGYYSLPAGHRVLIYHDGNELNRMLRDHPNSKVIVDGYLTDESTLSILETINLHRCDVITSARPMFIFTTLRKYYSGIDRLTFKVLYLCK